MTTVDAAYAEVERVTRARARNFAYGIMLLPKAKRRAIAAIYAFAREVDDIADDPRLEDGAKRQRLEELRAGSRTARTRVRCSSRSPTRAAGIRSRAMRSTISSTVASRTRSRRGTRRS